MEVVKYCLADWKLQLSWILTMIFDINAYTIGNFILFFTYINGSQPHNTGSNDISGNSNGIFASPLICI
jgi:hypothetical protein